MFVTKCIFFISTYIDCQQNRSLMSYCKTITPSLRPSNSPHYPPACVCCNALYHGIGYPQCTTTWQQCCHHNTCSSWHWTWQCSWQKAVMTYFDVSHVHLLRNIITKHSITSNWSSFFSRGYKMISVSRCHHREKSWPLGSTDFRPLAPQ